MPGPERGAVVCGGDMELGFEIGYIGMTVFQAERKIGTKASQITSI